MIKDEKDKFEPVRRRRKVSDYSIDLDDKRLKNYKGLISILIDLSFVKDSLKLLLEAKANKQTIIERSLFISSIVTYGRCFNQAKGRGLKLEAKDYVKPDFQELHAYLIELRNEYIAHAGISDGEKIYVEAQFNLIKGSKGVLMGIGYNYFAQMGLRKEEIQSFYDLVEDLNVTLDEKSKIAKDSYKASLTPVDKNELLKKAMLKKD